VCYEAGPTGYALYWQLVEISVACEVVAPTVALGSLDFSKPLLIM
jgi:hypothetical protein